MGLFSKIFGEKDNRPDEEEAADAIKEAQDLITIRSSDAMKSLAKTGSKYHELTTFDAPLHESFRNAVIEAWERQNSTSFEGDVPSVKMVPWETWPQPMMKDLAEIAREMQEAVMYLVPPEKQRPKSAQAEVLSLIRISQEERTVGVLIGEEAAMFSREFILDASENIPPDYEEILQDLSDYAEKNNLTLGMIVA